MTEEEQRAAVIREARSWLGTPYHHRARLKGIGVDCAMLLAEVYFAAGLIPYVSPEFYPPDWAMHRDTERYLGWVTQHAHETDDLLQANVVLYKVGRCFSHSAIIVEWPTIIHAMLHDGCVLGDASKDHRLLFNRDGSPRDRRVYTLW